MATVYSLICFGGKDGKTVTFTDAGDIVNLTNHGLRDGTGVVFTDNSGNTLPTGLSKDTTYYAKSTGANTFTLYTTSALTTQVTFTGTGTGTHKVKSAYYVGLSDKSRWTYSTVEYIFDGLAAWNTHRTSTVPALSSNTENCEIGMVFDDINTVTVDLAIPAAQTNIYPINSAGHNGTYNAGYRFWSTTGFSIGLRFTGFSHSFDGLTVYTANGNCNLVRVDAALNTFSNCFIINHTSSPGYALQLNGNANKIYNNVIVRGSQGIQAPLGTGNLVYNNTVVKCTTGFDSNATAGFYFNNIAVGNTTNWGTNPSSTLNGAGYNGGESGNTPWYKGTDTGIKTLTADNSTFVDYTNNDLRPAGTSGTHTSTSPLVDAGVTIAQIDAEDNAGSLRPSYKNGSATAWDIGAFEFDWGYGDPPASGTLAGTNIADGTRIKIAKQSDGTEYVNAVVSGTTKSDAYTGANQSVYIYARKGSATPFYKPLRISGSIIDGSMSYDLAGLQIEDIARGASYAAGVATDWTFNSTTGAITHASGTTRYTVQDLYSWHADHYDDSDTVDDNPLMHGTTPTQFELINSGDISDADLEDLYGGSIEFQDGTLWSNLWTTNTMAASHPVYVVQGTSKYTSYWADGPIDVLLKVSNAGTLISSGLVTAYARQYGYTFAHYTADLSAGGRNVAPLSTLAEPTCQAISAATVATYTDVIYGAGGSYDLGEGGGAGTYDMTIDCAGRTLEQVFARTMYDCRDVSTATIQGIPGWRWQKANAAYEANAATPFGTYSGGFWTVAKGVWLIDVASSDTYNYSVTDAAGVTHQLTQPAGAATANVAANTRIVLYNTTQDVEIDNQLVSGAYSYTITTEAATNDVLTLYYFKEGYEEGSSTMIWTGNTQAFVVNQIAHPYVSALRTELSITDYTTITEFAPDTTGHVYIESNDPDGNSMKARAAIWYNGILTTQGGARYFRGGMTILSTAAFRINASVVDMLFENLDVDTPLVFTDVQRRLYRDDGTSIIAPTSYSIHNDYSGVPDVVETGVSGLTGAESAQLMALPSATSVASAVWSKTLP